MKKCKHTPGVWRFFVLGDANQNCLLTNDVRWVIAFSQNGELNTPEQIANAKLIAAAPDLLDALIKAEEHMSLTNSTLRTFNNERLKEGGFEDQEAYNKFAERIRIEAQENSALLKQIRDAIKKATE